MRSKPVALLLADLGVTKTHSRPHVSDDNPYSESQFKTMKYHPSFPERFGGIEHSRAFSGDFFDWYNNDHHHSGLALFTPADVHHGLVEQKLEQRQAALDAAFEKHPERFLKGRPIAKRPAMEVWINKPVAVPDATSRSETPAKRSRGADDAPGTSISTGMVH
jgi:putative transposase